MENEVVEVVKRRRGRPARVETAESLQEKQRAFEAKKEARRKEVLAGKVFRGKLPSWASDEEKEAVAKFREEKANKPKQGSVGRPRRERTPEEEALSLQRKAERQERLDKGITLKRGRPSTGTRVVLSLEEKQQKRLDILKSGKLLRGKVPEWALREEELKLIAEIESAKPAKNTNTNTTDEYEIEEEEDKSSDIVIKVGDKVKHRKTDLGEMRVVKIDGSLADVVFVDSDKKWDSVMVKNLKLV